MICCKSPSSLPYSKCIPMKEPRSEVSARASPFDRPTHDFVKTRVAQERAATPCAASRAACFAAQSGHDTERGHRVDYGARKGPGVRSLWGGARREIRRTRTLFGMAGARLRGGDALSRGRERSE